MFCNRHSATYDDIGKPFSLMQLHSTNYRHSEIYANVDHISYPSNRSIDIYEAWRWALAKPFPYDKQVDEQETMRVYFSSADNRAGVACACCEW